MWLNKNEVKYTTPEFLALFRQVDPTCEETISLIEGIQRLADLPSDHNGVANPVDLISDILTELDVYVDNPDPIIRKEVVYALGRIFFILNDEKQLPETMYIQADILVALQALYQDRATDVRKTALSQSRECISSLSATDETDDYEKSVPLSGDYEVQ